jgi:hypothetical protein
MPGMALASWCARHRWPPSTGMAGAIASRGGTVSPRPQRCAVAVKFCEAGSVESVESVPSNGDEEVVVLVDGPIDGREYGVQAHVGELLVPMSEGARHLYERTSEIQDLPK